MKKTKLHFRKACDQIVILNHRLNDLERRYKAAKAQGRHSAVYTMRLRLAVTEGIRNMYHDYAIKIVSEISQH